MAKGDTVSLIPELYPLLGSYSVAFIQLVANEPGKLSANPCGSGTLITVHGRFGILTAAHVAKRLKRLKRIGLFTVPSRPGRAPALEFTGEACVYFCIGEENTGKSGPDIAFVQLPLNIEEHLRSAQLFYNIEVRRRGAEQSLGGPLIADVVVAMAQQKSEPKLIEVARRVDTHCMDVAVARTLNRRNSPDGFDYFDAIIDHEADGVARPESYGGYSGGSVWRVGNTLDPQDRILLGLVYYQSEPDKHGRRVLTCHGPKSIYGQLVTAIENARPTY